MKSTPPFHMIKAYIFKGIIWNSLLIIGFSDNDHHARFSDKITQFVARRQQYHTSNQKFNTQG